MVSCFGGFFSLDFKNQAIAWFSLFTSEMMANSFLLTQNIVEKVNPNLVHLLGMKTKGAA